MQSRKNNGAALNPMLPENPYASPLPISESLHPTAQFANYYSYPTWRFWLLGASIPPGVASLGLVGEIARQHNDRPGYSVFMILVAISSIFLVGLTVTMFLLWKAPSSSLASPTRIALSVTGLIAIAAITFMSGASLFISAMTLTYIIHQQRLYFEAHNDAFNTIPLAIGACTCLTAIPIGVWLGLDYLGKSRRK